MQLFKRHGAIDDDDEEEEETKEETIVTTQTLVNGTVVTSENVVTSAAIGQRGGADFIAFVLVFAFLVCVRKFSSFRLF
jgi:uncharacterized protein YqhQ